MFDFIGETTLICSTNDGTETKSGVNITPNDLVLAVDPFAGSRIEVVFTVSDVLAQDQDNILLLVYSSKTSPSPQLPTPASDHKLELDMAHSEFLAMYDIPAQTFLVQGSTRLGAANPAPRSKVSFSVNLDTGVLPTFMNNNEKAYLQAALLPKKDYNAGNFTTMILSELETIGFVEYTCPEDSTQRMALNDAGELDIENTSTGDKIVIETTKETQATTKTK